VHTVKQIKLEDQPLNEKYHHITKVHKQCHSHTSNQIEFKYNPPESGKKYKQVDSVNKPDGNPIQMKDLAG
jgi:hypothetical protein